MNPLDWGRGLRTRDIPPAVQELVTVRQGGRFCVECRALGVTTPPDVPLEIDHIQALASDGDSHFLNLRWACRSHNRGRRDRHVRSPIKRPRWERRRPSA